ncbi:MAG: hypothetical protein ABI131_06375 [Nostocoides sp.]
MQMQANVTSGAAADVVAVGRALAVVGSTATVSGLLAAGLWVVGVARWSSVSAPGPAGLADALTLLLTLGALLLLGWFAIGVVLEALSVLPGAVGRWAARTAERLTPALATRVVALVLGSTVATAALPTTALADTTGGGPRAGVVATAPDPGFAPVTAAAPSPGSTTSAPAPDPGFVPSRPTVRPVLSPSVLTPPGTGLSAPRGVVVHRGDTLWAIAARDLGPEATDAEVAGHWPRWFAANRDVIGGDPDLILPGQVLRHPGWAVTP